VLTPARIRAVGPCPAQLSPGSDAPTAVSARTARVLAEVQSWVPAHSTAPAAAPDAVTAQPRYCNGLGTTANNNPE